MAFLTETAGPQPGRRVDLLGHEFIMGRHPDCQIVIEVSAVSRQHAKVVVEGEEHFVEDLNSRNGTFVNEEMVQGRRKLADGDSVRVCDVSFTFHCERTAQTTEFDGQARARSGGTSAVLIDDGGAVSSTIMSKIDVTSSSSGRVTLNASPETKLTALVEITTNLGRALRLDDVLPQVLNSLFKIFVQADRGFIALENEDGTVAPRWARARRSDSDETIRMSRTIVSQVMESKEAILSADAASDERFEMSQSIADFRIRSVMCAPLITVDDRVLGVLQVDTLDQRHRFDQDDLEVLASVAAQAAIAIDNAQLHEIALTQKEMERDLELAREVQQSFLPSNSPQVQGYSFYDFYRAANHIGGDYYDYIQLPDGRIATIVADVVGHGVAAAMLMAKLSAETRFWLASESHPARAVFHLNNALSRLDLDRFVTMILTVFDPKTNRVSIVNAGHMAPIHRKVDGSIEEPGAAEAGLPLGIVEDMEYDQVEIDLASGEFLTLYTDGINECHGGPNGDEMYKIQRLKQKIQAGPAIPEESGKHVVSDVLAFLGQGAQEDDMCLVSYGLA